MASGSVRQIAIDTDWARLEQSLRESMESDMIAVSDAVLITVSVAALSLGLYRWQGNVQQAMLGTGSPVATSPAQGNNTIAGETQNAPGATLASENAGNASDAASANTSLQPIQRDPQEPVVVTDQAPATPIDVANDADTTASNEAMVDIPPLGSYTVQSGDTLSVIAEQFGTTVSTLQQINDIDGSLIRIGQELRYPQSSN